jgi:hypothetical protein
MRLLKLREKSSFSRVILAKELEEIEEESGK